MENNEFLKHELFINEINKHFEKEKKEVFFFTIYSAFISKGHQKVKTEYMVDGNTINLFFDKNFIGSKWKVSVTLAKIKSQNGFELFLYLYIINNRYLQF